MAMSGFYPGGVSSLIPFFSSKPVWAHLSREDSQSLWLLSPAFGIASLRCMSGKASGLSPQLRSYRKTFMQSSTVETSPESIQARKRGT